MTSSPLVSIGLPTYNRSQKLERAMDFVLAQDYQNIEVIISDNASTDATPQVCQRLCSHDRRVRYIRQPTNIGPSANYREVLRAASGEMYMALADDDWIHPNYVSACLDKLLSSPDLVLVCGQAQMYREGKFSHSSVATTLLDDSPSDRVVRYYKTVAENGAFHGIVRRDLLMGLPWMPNVMAGDWLWMASIAFRGKIATLDSTQIRKHLGGASASWDAIVSTLGLPKWQARYWSQAILASVVSDIAWRSPTYAPLGTHGRAILASRVALAIALKWRLWHRWTCDLGQLLRDSLR
jgi:glycosyltransferase involved in cell wall biosynthesis